MPLPIETECITKENLIFPGPTTDPEKFLIYTWEGYSQQGGGNQKISVPLTVVSQTPEELPLLRRRLTLPPRITLGKPVPPEPPVVMGGGTPDLPLTASSRIDRKTKRRNDEYKLLRSQPLPAQERHEYQAYPEDIRPGQNTQRKSQHSEGDVIYHGYLSFVWQYLGLQGCVLDCLNNLESVCIAHYLPPEMLEQSLHTIHRPNSGKKRQSMRFSSALRYRMEAFISQGRVALLVGNLRAVTVQLGISTGEGFHDIQELENFQAFEEMAAQDRGLPVLYLYPFQNIYEMARAEGLVEAQDVEHRGAYDSKLRCLLQPGPLQRKLEDYADPSFCL